MQFCEKRNIDTISLSKSNFLYDGECLCHWNRIISSMSIYREIYMCIQKNSRFEPKLQLMREEYPPSVPTPYFGNMLFNI